MEGVRVHGGNGKLDQLGWSAKRLKSLGGNSLFSSYLPDTFVIRWLRSYV